jgi:hypothetical protein
MKLLLSLLLPTSLILDLLLSFEIGMVQKKPKSCTCTSSYSIAVLPAAVPSFFIYLLRTLLRSK